MKFIKETQTKEATYIIPDKVVYREYVSCHEFDIPIHISNPGWGVFASVVISKDSDKAKLSICNIMSPTMRAIIIPAVIITVEEALIAIGATLDQ